MNLLEALEEIDECGSDLQAVLAKIDELYPQLDPMKSGRKLTQNEFTRHATAIYDENRAIAFGER